MVSAEKIKGKLKIPKISGLYKFVKKASETAGLPPGTVVHVGEKKSVKTRITLFDYDKSAYLEKELSSIEDCFPFKDKTSVTWINIDGIEQIEIIQKIDTHFGIHPLVLEDIVNTSQRPKMDDYEDYIFMVFKMLDYRHEAGIISEQISLILGANYVISFQETEGDIFDTIRDRIRTGKGRVRVMGPDYLAYALLDAVVDHYFEILEGLGEKIEKLEEKVSDSSGPEVTQDIISLKRDMIYLRKQVWPLREMISGLQRVVNSKLIKKTTSIYLRDVYDHTIQVVDTIESFRDMISGLHDVYLSTISNKMNEVMKVLTVIATVFIPMTFIAGVYGMNFKYMPELEWENGYYIVLAAMATLGLGMLLYFKKQRWF
jgi:magnesium transporter